MVKVIGLLSTSLSALDWAEQVGTGLASAGVGAVEDVELRRRLTPYTIDGRRVELVVAGKVGTAWSWICSNQEG